jgi:hypothetical protein
MAASCGWKRADRAPTARANAIALGINNILIGDELTLAGFGSCASDPCVPDFVINATIGTLWTAMKQIMNNRGFLAHNLNVPLIAYNRNLRFRSITEHVSNQQVASTLLAALGLPLAQVDGWRLVTSPVLSGLF